MYPTDRVGKRGKINGLFLYIVYKSAPIENDHFAHTRLSNSIYTLKGVKRGKIHVRFLYIGNKSTPMKNTPFYPDKIYQNV
jgi:hypothetical protein